MKARLEVEHYNNIYISDYMEVDDEGLDKLKTHAKKAILGYISYMKIVFGGNTIYLPEKVLQKSVIIVTVKDENNE